MQEETKSLEDEFVRVAEGQFFLQGNPYSYVGTNAWFAAYLGSENIQYGDRDRLKLELDLLKELGITNLRILGASERSPLRDSMKPAISYKGEVEREDILVGLDFTLAEMAKRDMKAVVYLNNFWEWSGGMATYLSWVNGGEIVDMADPDRPWPAFALFSSEFYADKEAIALYRNYVRSLLMRTNSISGLAYKDDPTIMAWQLANEPRPGDGEISRPNLPVFYGWIKDTTSLIKSLAPNQLVSIGHEGTKGCLDMEECVIQAHSNTGVDYFTFHLWPANWGWFDPLNSEDTYASAMARVSDYIGRHIALAEELKMPAVLEEFGLNRDQGAFSRQSTTRYRDHFYQLVFSEIENSIESRGPLTGSNFWAWGGTGKALHEDAKWRKGDKTFLGDPPQEPQGLYSVFSSDASTLKIISRHAETIARDR